MKIEFSESHAFHFGEYPMLPVELIGPRGKSVQTYALLDSGADMPLFHSNWAERIGIDWEAGLVERVGSIHEGDFIEVVTHRIDLIVGSVKVSCGVAFSDGISEDAESQLIGRQAIFDAIRFGFRQRLGFTYLAPE